MNGTTLLHYVTIEKIGESDRSKTYRAIDLKQENKTLFLAVKIFHHPVLSKTAKKRFGEDVARVIRAQPPGICRIFGFEETEDGKQFIAMEHLDGASLRQRLAKGPMPLPAVAAFAIRIVQNLANLHKTGTFHHNLKPGNVIITHKNTVVLTDFGINMLFPVAATDLSQIIPESIYYLAPEQIRGAPGDIRTEVWGVGVLLYEMLSARRPFRGETVPELVEAILQADPAPLPNFSGPAELMRTILRRTLAKNPQARYGSMAELFADLKKLAGPAAQGITQTVELAVETCDIPVAGAAAKPAVTAQPPAAPLPTPPPGVPALLVLPLSDPQPPAGQEHFHRGFLIELMRTLSRTKDLYVPPLAAVLAQEKAGHSPREMARKFGARQVLQGKIARDADAIYLLLRMVDLNRARVEWEKGYRIAMENWITARETLARQVGEEVLAYLRQAKTAERDMAAKNGQRPPLANSPSVPPRETPPTVEPETTPVTEENEPRQDAEAAPPVEEAEAAPPVEETQARQDAETAPPVEETQARQDAEMAPETEETQAGQDAETVIAAEEARARQETTAITREPVISKEAAGHSPPVSKHPDIPRKNGVSAPSVLEATASPPENHSADENAARYAYLKGVKHLHQWTVEDLNLARKFFQTAVESNPDFAPAYAGLSRVYNTLGIYGAYAPRAVMPKAMQNAYFALEKDPLLPEALICLGTALAAFEWDWRNARICLEKGIQLDTENANAYLWYAINDLIPHRLFERAIQALNDALDLEPDNLIIQATLGQAYFYARDYDAAIAHNRRMLEKQPDGAIFHYNLARVYWQQSEHETALEHFHTALKAFSDNMNVLANFACAAAQVNREDIARKMLQQLLAHSREQYVSAYDIALVCIGLNDAATAIKWLSKALDERAHAAIYLAVDPMLDPVRDHPRFGELLTRLKLEPLAQK